jgi:hypothetical protein
MNLDELRDLVDARLEGTISPEGRARLEALLRDDPAAQEWLLSYSDLHACLQWERRDVAATRRPAPLRRWFAAAAAAAIVIAALIAVGRSRETARLVRTVDAEWERPPASSSLLPGSYVLRRGLAEITFDPGVALLVEGPAEFELRNSRRVVVRRGKTLCRVSPQGIGFVLETPKAEVLDLGTEFGVAVSDDGRTDLQVNEGEVLATLKGGTQQRLLGGQAVRLEISSREVPFQPDRFVRFLPGPEDPSGRGTWPYNAPRFDAVHVLPAPHGVVIDGDLSDWDLSGRFETSCDPPFEAYALQGAMMYDDRFLYVAARVADPFPMRSQISPAIESDVYGRGGSVALRIGSDRKMGWPLRGLAEDARQGRAMTEEDVSDKLSFLVLWYYAPENRACIFIRHGMDFHGVRVNPPGYQGAFRRLPEGNGYTMEYAIPWALLHADDDPPRAGDVLGATWLVHWSDSAGKTWKGQLIDVVNPAEKGWNFHNAGTWGRAIYEATGPLPPGAVQPLRPSPRK